jgi:hypothetical protein
MLIFVDDKGFVMDYTLSGPELKYTMRRADAEVFEMESQARFAVRVNKISVDKVSFVSYNKVTQQEH